VMEATARPVPIDVFCVEHGRWSGSESFGQSRSAGSDGGIGSGRSVAARAARRNGAVGGRGSGYNMGGGNPRLGGGGGRSEVVTVTASGSAIALSAGVM